MADIGIWGLGAIASPAATDRLPLESGVGAGGYSTRGDFLFWNGSNRYFASRSGIYGLQLSSPKADFTVEIDGTNNAGGTTITYSWAAGGQGPLKFANASGEVARFDPAGNFGLGVSPAVRFHVKASAGASEIARFETTTARGSGSGYLSIYDPTGRKCYIGYGAFNDGLTFVNEMNAPVIFGTNANYRWQVGASGNFEPLADNTYQIGYGAARPSVLFAATGTINTSDEREKTWRGEPSADELRAAKRIIAELGFYRWNEAIAEKGDDARYHFGPRAQQVWAIMVDEGLIDPNEEGVTPSSSYAFLCYDEWEAIEPVDAVEEVRDEDDNIIVPAQPAQPGREAGNRFGIRPDQLALFLIAAQEARIAAIEAALSEGE